MKDCGKVTYKNPVSAWRAIRALSSSKNALQNHRKIYKRCTAYHCDQCHQWHTTRQNRDRPADWPRHGRALETWT